MGAVTLRGIFVLLLAVVFGANSTRLAKYPLHRCGVCKAIAEEMWEKKNSLLNQERQPVKLSHRLGKGKWDHHGTGGVKKLEYETSELMAIEVVEGLCDNMPGDYKLRDSPDTGLRVISKNTTLRAAETYSKQEKDAFDSKAVKVTCHEFLDEYDEETHSLIRQKFETLDEFSDELCKSLFKACDQMETAIKKEKASKRNWERKRNEKWEKVRSDGISSSIQVAEFHFAYQGVELDLTTYEYTASSESGDHPKTEGPEKAVDNNENTKWLDHQKRGFIITFNTSVPIDAFTFTTANDNPERDPVRWVVEAHNTVIKPLAESEEATEPTTDTANEAEEASTEPPKEPEPEPEPEWVTLVNQTSVVSVTFDRLSRVPWQNFSADAVSPFLVYRIRPLLGKNLKPKKVKKTKKVKVQKEKTNEEKSRFATKNDEL
eukprot:TRINITY_DN4252_c4_g1_i1.p1 TRINITY_DN4252_c4_g1~~TRINITY_DN4252_c4_g1_i1.p1  ORF type:complete len:432 (+),score=81.95 TRINITY_DN4252_c4_g1_i1:38-1333(+)